MAYKSLSFHGILAVLGITAHHTLQPGLFSGLTKIPTPALMDVLLTCQRQLALLLLSVWSQPLGAQQQAEEEQNIHSGFCRGPGSPGAPTQHQWYRHHEGKGPEQEPKLSPLCADAGVAGKQMESKVVANSQVVPVCFVKPA